MRLIFQHILTPLSVYNTHFVWDVTLYADLMTNGNGVTNGKEVQNLFTFLPRTRWFLNMKLRQF